MRENFTLMLIRFFVSNMLSFNEQMEFNLLPGPKIKRLSHHKYQIKDFEALKLSAIYGANGAGKSNLIHALKFLINKVRNKKDLVTRIPEFLLNNQSKDKSQILGVEFIHKNTSFLYGLEIKGEKIISEELYNSGLGKIDDELIFERKLKEDESLEVNFPEKFEKDEEGQTLKNIIEKNLGKPKEPIIQLLDSLNIDNIPEISKAFSWFEKGIDIILPDSKPSNYKKYLITDSKFREAANKMLQAFDTGAMAFDTISEKVNKYFNEAKIQEINDLIEDVKLHPEKQISLDEEEEDEDLVLENKEGKVYVTRLVLKHSNTKNTVNFSLKDESDGTKRLIDYIPFLMNIINSDKTYFIDEIERSIHPLIVKTLISKFSELEETKGQLVFTTHESNLLDQNIFRSDEIWFVEKNNKGESELYPLSDFKEHHTKDIGKGYLNGRYGAIPFLGNLKDLNWH